ncbi:uroporphyrinogen-III synthase [Salimicrobium halophilum]|uniref:Uroporphyrinogen-III synthase n=1 Tax=Salimicrobium halophilum TaxID=86666 RepID=A0A1G8PIA4_9BACI|nr:uroporphyrinogen-III synthase [Salimicrobium halophilum]SDI92249.1 uroporphyrinogen-III synthase [Salimicrobium halophilum]
MSMLLGKRVLITRAEEQSGSLKERLESRGAKTLVVPLLTFVKRRDARNAQILSQLDQYDWVIITSTNGVRFYKELVEEYIGYFPPHLTYAAVGKKTEHALKKEGLHVAFVPSEFTAEALVEEWLPKLHEGERVLHIRGNRSRVTLPEGMKKQRISFDSMTAYDTLIVEENGSRLREVFEHGGVDALTFFSPSQVEAFLELIGNHFEEALRIPCFCIGPTTEKRASEAGFQEVYTPSIYTAEALVDKMEEHFKERG